MPRTRIKICCMASPAEVALAVAAGADAVGIVGPMPSGPGPVDDDTARVIAASVPAPVDAWLLTQEEDAEAILAHCERVGATTVQICRHVASEHHDALAELAPWLRRVQVVHVEDDSALDIAAGYGARPSAYVLDSGRPSAPTAALGGTGAVHDWAISARIVAASPRPVFLAGGLKPDNVAEAIATVRPFGVDVCSGLRPREYALDAELVDAFVAAVAIADAASLSAPRASGARRGP